MHYIKSNPMQIRFITVVMILGITALFSSCAKEGPTGPTGPAGPGYTGTISGHVSLYDQYGNKILSNLDSVGIQLNANPNNSVLFTADTTVRPNIYGYYIYNNIFTGQYYFTAADTGYGATTVNYFYFVSGALNVDIKLSAKPAFSLISVAYQDSITQVDSLIISCTPDPQIRSCIIFVNGSSSTATGENYVLSYIKTIPANATQINAIITKQELIDAGFVHDSLVYYTVFSHAVNDQSAYEDQSTGKTVYNAISNPTVDTTRVP